MRGDAKKLGGHKLEKRCKGQRQLAEASRECLGSKRAVVTMMITSPSSQLHEEISGKRQQMNGRTVGRHQSWVETSEHPSCTTCSFPVQFLRRSVADKKTDTNSLQTEMYENSIRPLKHDIRVCTPMNMSGSRSL